MLTGVFCNFIGFGGQKALLKCLKYGISHPDLYVRQSAQMGVSMNLLKNNHETSWRYAPVVSKIIMAFAVLAFIPIMWISFYNHPSADDYNYSELYTQAAVENGENVFGILAAALQTTSYFQQHWQGTYTAAFLDSLQPGIFGAQEEFYALTAYIICISMFAAIYCFLRELLLAFGWNCSHKFAASLVILLTIIEGFPSPVQGLFWYTGAMTYQFFWSLLFLQAALLLNVSRSTKLWGLKLFSGIINAFLLAGGNHISAFIAILVSLGFIVFTVLAKKKAAFLISCMYTLTSTGGFIVVMTASGTAVRAGTLERQSIVKTMLMSIFNSASDAVHYSNLPLFLLCFLLVLLLGKHLVSETNVSYFKFRYAFFMLILSFGILCVSFCVPYYAMGSGGAGRIADMRYALFVMLVVINFLYGYGCILALLYTKEKLGDAVYRLLLVCRETVPAIVKKISVVLFSGFAMTVIVFFSCRVSVSMNCILELASREAQQFHEEKLEYIGTDIPNPVNMPRMIFYSSSMQDA